MLSERTWQMLSGEMSFNIKYSLFAHYKLIEKSPNVLSSKQNDLFKITFPHITEGWVYIYES